MSSGLVQQDWTVYVLRSGTTRLDNVCPQVWYNKTGQCMSSGLVQQDWTMSVLGSGTTRLDSVCPTVL